MEPDNRPEPRSAAPWARNPRYGRSRKKREAAAAATAEESTSSHAASDSATVPQPPGCAYYMQAKQRFCRMQATNGNQYCGNHSFIVVGDGNARVACPADPGHTVLLSELEVHLRKCPGRLNALQEKVRGLLSPG